MRFVGAFFLMISLASAGCAVSGGPAPDEVDTDEDLTSSAMDTAAERSPTEGTTSELEHRVSTLESMTSVFPSSQKPPPQPWQAPDGPSGPTPGTPGGEGAGGSPSGNDK